MDYQCEISEMPAQHTLSVRIHSTKQDLPQAFDRWYSELGKYLVELRHPPAGMPYARYFSMSGDDLDVEIGFPVSAPLPPKGNIRPGTLPGGKMAAVMHVGPYDGLPHAFHALQAFIEKQGLATTGIWYEMYANDPREVPPEQYQTLALIELK